MALVSTLGAVLLVTGCSSSVNGTPIVGGAPSASTGFTGSASAPSPATSAPPSGPSLPTSAVGGSKFCQDFLNEGSFGSLGSANGSDQLASTWRKLAAEAPSDIKSDMGVIADYLQKLADGSVGATDLQKLQPAAVNVGTYVGAHCH